MEFKWLEKCNSWHEADTFRISSNSKSKPYLVGEKIGHREILKAWVNNNGFLKAYRVKCLKCGIVTEYVSSTNLKAYKSSACQSCANRGNSRAVKVSYKGKEYNLLMFIEKFYDSELKYKLYQGFRRYLNLDHSIEDVIKIYAKKDIKMKV